MIRNHRFAKFYRDIVRRTPFVKMVVLLAVLWGTFAGGIYLAERGMEGTSIHSYGHALYWSIAAFSTAGIADTPLSGGAQFIGGIWMIIGSTLFFGTIVATVTAYFMRPLLRPARQIIDTIEYNLEQLDNLSVDELDLLKDTVDTLIVHMERSKLTQERLNPSS